jgi:quercetin dioxygenase-like cupin family protein
METSEKDGRKINWNDIPKEQVNDMLSRRLITGDKVMLAHVYLKKGCVVPFHQHANEQLTYILEGSLVFNLENEKTDPILLQAGDVLVIPGNVPHMAVALEDTLDMDVFSPPREDWLAKTDLYLRKEK